MRLNREKYKQMMEGRNLQAKDICRLTGLSEKSFSWLMENGFAEVCTMERLADAAGCTVSEIIAPDYGEYENAIEFLKDGNAPQ